MVTPLPKIRIPPVEPVASEEIERRRKLFEETVRLRDEIGLIGLTVEELLEEEDERDD